MTETLEIEDEGRQVTLTARAQRVASRNSTELRVQLPSCRPL